MPQERLNQIQAGFNTPKATILEIVENFSGHKVTSLERIIAGESNEVYAISTNFNKYILRIAWREGNDFEKENWAKEQAAEFGIPVNKFLEIGFLENKGKKHQYSLEKFVEGTIHSIYQTDKSILEPIFESAGEILGRIHSIPTIGFGDLDENYHGKYTSFVEKIQKDNLDQKSDFEKVAKKRNLDWELLAKAFEILEQNLAVFASEPSVLVHGDFNHKHFVVDENLQIQAILDWGEVRSGSAIETFASWQFWFGDYFPVEILTRKYGNSAYLQDNFELKLKMGQILQTLSVIDYYDQIDDFESFGFVMETLRKVLEK